MDIIFETLDMCLNWNVYIYQETSKEPWGIEFKGKKKSRWFEQEMRKMN